MMRDMVIDGNRITYTPNPKQNKLDINPFTSLNLMFYELRNRQIAASMNVSTIALRGELKNIDTINSESFLFNQPYHSTLRNINTKGIIKNIRIIVNVTLLPYNSLIKGESNPPSAIIFSYIVISCSGTSSYII